MSRNNNNRGYDAASNMPEGLRNKTDGTPSDADKGNCATLDLRIDELDLSTRPSNILSKAGIEYVGDLVQTTEQQLLKENNCGRTTISAIQNKLSELDLHLGMHLPYWNSTAAAERRKAQQILSQGRRRPLRIESSACLSLEDELRTIVRSVASERDCEIVLKLYGWTGEGPRTLESVGLDYKVSRERIRQIAKRAIERLGEYDVNTPYLAKAVELVRRNCPATPTGLAELLKFSKISRTCFNPGGLTTACESLSVEAPFVAMNVESATLFAARNSADKIATFFRVCRRQTSSRGCINFEAVCDELQFAEAERTNLRRSAALRNLYEWLDHEHRWLVALSPQRNRLSNLVAKVLSVSPRLSLNELRTAIARSRRLPTVPPSNVLGRLVVLLGLATVERDKVLASPNLPYAIEAGSTEETMISILHAHGPALGWERFQELCVAAGMNPITFAIYLSSSPVLARLARGIYSLVGADIPPGTVEDVAKEVAAARKPTEWGWTKRGSLWYALWISGTAFSTGAVAIPSFVGGFVAGEWRPKLAGEEATGSVKCKDNFLWGIRRPLLSAGAEQGDVCILEFDLTTRFVDLTIGGEELIEIWESGDIELPAAESSASNT